jgi:fatty acid desaturase
MGEAKRRKAALGDRYGQQERMLPWLPFTKSQGEQFVKISTRSAWIGIGFLVAAWITVRIIGPGLGWWEVN